MKVTNKLFFKFKAIEAARMLLSLCLLCWILPFNIMAQAPFNYDEFRKEYFRLRNIDPDYKQLSQWNQVFENYSSQYAESSTNLPERFYLDFSVLLQQLAKLKQEPELYKKSVEVLDQLVQRHPSSDLADDARLKQIYSLQMLNSSDEIINERYAALIKDYPNSDSAQLARAKIELANKPTSAVESAASALADKTNLRSVVIDPGHGGEDFGALSSLGLFEKDVALAIALELEKILLAQKIARPILTRRSDLFMPLKHRVDIANQHQAELFLSIHNNASPKQNQQGITTYILDQSSDEAARLLAERENKEAGGADTSDLSFILEDLIQQAKNPQSLILAEIVNKQLDLFSKQRKSKIKNNGIKRAPFFVLLGTHMPSVLLELMFIDYQQDAELLADPQFRIEIAEALARAIRQFLEVSNAG